MSLKVERVVKTISAQEKSELDRNGKPFTSAGEKDHNFSLYNACVQYAIKVLKKNHILLEIDTSSVVFNSLAFFSTYSQSLYLGLSPVFLDE